MRKIETADEKKKKEKRRNLIIGFLMSFLLIFSTAGFALYYKSEDKVVSYNGFKFSQDNGFWSTEAKGKQLKTTFLPQDVENISVQGFYTLEEFLNKPLYFYKNTSQGYEAIYEIEMNIPAQRYQEACYLTDCNPELVIKNCSENIIIFYESDKDKIEKKEGCIFVYFNNSEVMVVDRLIYKIYGVV